MDVDYALFGIMIAIQSAIVIPLTVFLVKLKGKAEQHDRCITRLESKIDSLDIKFEKEIEGIKKFFIDWIQRLENVTRDRKTETTFSMQSTGNGSSNTESKDVIGKLNVLVEAVNKLSEELTKIKKNG